MLQKLEVLQDQFENIFDRSVIWSRRFFLKSTIHAYQCVYIRTCTSLINSWVTFDRRTHPPRPALPEPSKLPEDVQKEIEEDEKLIRMWCGLADGVCVWVCVWVHVWVYGCGLGV